MNITVISFQLPVAVLSDPSLFTWQWRPAITRLNQQTETESEESNYLKSIKSTLNTLKDLLH